MTHIDEGTIHAWLDGQLDASQAREVETHVASCAQCSDAVAEARGLIAGSSRVLLALDDVPGGVVPAASRAVPPKPPRRKWQAAKWVTSVSALAAALIVAVVLRQSSQSETASLAIHDSSQAPPMAAPATPAVGETSAAPTAPTTMRSAGPAEPARVATQQIAHADTRASGRIATAQPRPLNDALAPRGAVAGGFSAASGAGIASPTNQAKAANAEVAQAPPVTAMADAAGQRPTPATAADERKMDVAAPVIVGCYAVSAARLRDPEPTAARAPATAPLTAQKSSRAAPSSAAAAADYAPAPSMIVRLDSIRGAEGLIARVAPADTVAGFWRVDGDTARVQLRNGATFSVALKNRVRCP